MWRTVYVAACACVVFSIERTSGAQVLAQHEGVNNRLLEGWHGVHGFSNGEPSINDHGNRPDAYLSRPLQTSDFPSDRFTTLICITAIICCWLLKPHRYQFQQFGSTAMRFDTITGILRPAASE
jgi:hypothetical protein